MPETTAPGTPAPGLDAAPRDAAPSDAAPSDAAPIDHKPRSRTVTDGIEATTSRGMLRAVGMGDADWAARVQAHVRRRPAAWTTVETGDVAGLLRDADVPLLVDDLGLWLTRAVDDAGAWEGPVDAVTAACDELVALPLHGRIGSLNASAAAAALLYGILQRRDSA